MILATSKGLWAILSRLLALFPSPTPKDCPYDSHPTWYGWPQEPE